MISQQCPQEEDEHNRFIWDENTDRRLLELHKQYGNFSQISKLVGATLLECQRRWHQLNPENSRTRQLWTPEEDQQLQDLVQQYGKKWSKICTIMNWRSGKQVRERYLNQLQGSINQSKWTDEEDKLIIKLYKKFGTRWSYISSFLEGRPENMVKNRFYANLKRRFQCELDDSDDSDDVQSSEEIEIKRKKVKKNCQTKCHLTRSKLKVEEQSTIVEKKSEPQQQIDPPQEQQNVFVPIFLPIPIYDIQQYYQLLLNMQMQFNK
ncbi:hypothetical protein pb186bvf_012967 [Paramecium bursaria]